MKKVLFGLIVVLMTLALAGCKKPTDGDGSSNGSNGAAGGGGAGTGGGGSGGGSGPSTPVRTKATGKIGEWEGAYEVGDIVFTDGSATPYTETLTLTDAQKEAAIAVIFYKGTGVNNQIKINGKISADETTVRTLGVGLYKSENPLTWATQDYDGHTLYAEAHGYDFDINPLEITTVWDNDAKRYDFRFGDKNGKNHLQVLGAYLDDPYDNWDYKDNPPGDDTDNPALYEAFYFAKNYKDITGNCVKGTSFEDGWYLPALAELYEIYLAFDMVKAANDLCGGDEFKLNEEIDSKHKNYNYYWSSNTETGRNCYAYAMNFTEDWGFSSCEKSLTESNTGSYGEYFMKTTFALAIREF